MRSRSSRLRSFVVALGVALAPWWAGAGDAHMAQDNTFFYDSGCCGGDDCRRAYPDEVQFVDGGYYVTTSKQFFGFDAVEVHQSRDGYFHVCQFNAADYVQTLVTRCLYVPPGAV